MLRSLYIKNYALIDEFTVSFSENLTVLSGETGAGKSIIVGALGLVLGEKAKLSSIRSGRELCVVEGRIEVEENHPSIELLKEKGIPLEKGEEIIVRRVVSRNDGTSRSFINGLQVTLKELQEVTSLLIDVHGQHEHQSLLDVKNHLLLLDKYGKLWDTLEEYRKSYKRIQELKRFINECTIDDREKLRRMDILQFSINEIEKAQLKEGEDQQLEKEYQILKNYEKLVSSIGEAYSCLQVDESSSISMLEKALFELSKIKEYSEEIGAMISELQNTRAIIEDVTHSLKAYIEGIEYEPGKIDRILSRLEQIKQLKRKYGATISEVNNCMEKYREELSNLELNEERIKKLRKELDEEIKKAGGLAIELSARRRVAARALEESVKEELSYLNMGKAQFRVHITYKQSQNGECEIEGVKYELASLGLDHVEFMISPNVGEPLLPLKGIASGGELSRIMLAIKTVLGNVDPISTFVFDEIDAGIGGKVSWAVGNRLKALSRTKQILCVTHQAQIASQADLNIRVEKHQSEGRTITQVRLLNEEEKTEEIARMISGNIISEAAISQAKQMIGGK